MSSTDLALRHEERATHGLQLAEEIFTPERRVAIAQFLNVQADDPAMLPYLATCAAYQLDPVMGQIWLIPQKVRVQDGDATVNVTRYRPAVGRDGYLAIARREPRYMGLKGQVVCEHDTFEVEYDGSEHEPKVLHKFASKPVAFAADEPPHRWRGKILGAWARAIVAGQPDTFFYAPIHEFMRMREKWEGPRGNRRKVVDANGRPIMEAEGAWGYVSTMILKAAQSYVLRIGLGITGLVPADEVAGLQGHELTGQPDTEGTVADASIEFDFSTVTADPGLASALDELVTRVNELAPLSWTPAKCEMVMANADDAQLKRIVAQLEREVEALEARSQRGSAPSAAEQPVPEPDGQVEEPAAESGSEADEEVADAEVVPEVDEEHVAALRKRLADLEERMEGVEPETEEFAALSDEIDQVSGELAAAENPDQGSLL